MDLFQSIKLIIYNIVLFMQKSIVWNNISWWDIVISLIALDIAVMLFRYFYRDAKDNK